MNLLTEHGVALLAVCYAIALALELWQLAAANFTRRVLSLAATLVGLLLHAAYLVALARGPASEWLSGWRQWHLLAALTISAVYFTLSCGKRRMALGLFLLPLVLALVALAGWSADAAPFPADDSSKLWALVHGLSLLAGTALVFLAFAAGAMYLVQAWRLKQKALPSDRFRLPSLEWLQRFNSRSIAVATALLGVGVASGVVLNQIRHAADVKRAVLDWSDPVVWSSMALFGWLVAVFIFGLVYKPARTGRKMAFLTVGGFVFLLLVLGLLSIGHSPEVAAAEFDAAAQASDRRELLSWRAVR
jgi:hypothetical protein